MTARRVALLAGFVLFVGTGVYSLLLPRLQDSRLPPRADAEACGAALAATWTPRDLVRVEPYWYREDANALLGALEARSHAPFSWFDERAELDLENAWRFERAWLIHLPQVTGRDADDLVPPPARVVKRTPFGDRLELVEVALPRAAIRFDLLADASGASVRRLFKDGKTEPCPWDGSVHRCDATEWKNVGVRWKDVGGSRRTCLYVEPTPDDSRVEIVFHDVALGARTVVWGGLSISGARKPSGGDVTFQVLVDGKLEVQHVEPPKAYRWNRFELDTAGAAGRGVDLTFVVGAKKTGWRQFCIDALSVDDLQGAPQP